jgi:hypothetical protein
MSLLVTLLQEAPQDAKWGIKFAAVVAFLAAALFPAKTQSKIWVKLFGTEWGTIAGGRAWTFVSVFVVGALMWAFLLWLPTHQ